LEAQALFNHPVPPTQAVIVKSIVLGERLVVGGSVESNKSEPPPEPAVAVDQGPNLKSPCRRPETLSPARPTQFFALTKCHEWLKIAAIFLDLAPIVHKNTFNFKVLGEHRAGMVIAKLGKEIKTFVRFTTLLKPGA